MNKALLYFVLVAFIFLLFGGNKTAATCPLVLPAARGTLNERISTNVPIQFPLAAYEVGTQFATMKSSGVFAGKRHAAEDAYGEAGTAVYAIADGTISFSDEAGGYGWLIIIDHPQINTYSLYGHLSPSRWHKGTGPVNKGELIAYLGNSDENGSSRKYGRMAPHLHFGIRQGQRADYPSDGDWRWMAGWTKNCPSEIGWLQPSQFIMAYAANSELILQRDFRAPAGAGWRRIIVPGLIGVWLTAVSANFYRLYRKKKRADGIQRPAMTAKD